MNNKKDYNGYENYQTWCLNLWLNNEQYLQKTMEEMAEECFRNAAEEKDKQGNILFTREKNANFELRDQIEEFVRENMIPELEGFVSDLFEMSFSQINFNEIAEGFIDAVMDEILEEEQEEL